MRDAIGFSIATSIICVATSCGTPASSPDTRPDATVGVGDGSATDGDACAAPDDVGALGPPETIAIDRETLGFIAVANGRALWLEDYLVAPKVFSEGSPPKLVLDVSATPLDANFAYNLVAIGDWFITSYEYQVGTQHWNDRGTVLGRIADGTFCTLNLQANGIAVDDSSAYILWVDSDFRVNRVTRMPLAPSLCESALPDPLDGTWGESIAVDDTRLYTYVWDDRGSGAYSILAGPKDGGAQVVAGSGVDTESYGGMRLVARSGVVAWARHHPDFISVLAPGLGVRTLVQEPDSIAQIALDGEYVYWTTAGAVKRIRVCGGDPEIIAEQNAFALAVDDVAIYWSTYDATTSRSTLVRVRKLGSTPDAARPDVASGSSDASDG